MRSGRGTRLQRSSCRTPPARSLSCESDCVTAQDALRTALRDHLGPSARSHGYKGSAPTWRKASALGDWAVVNIQSSSFSSSEHLRCVVNVAFAPEPWLRWHAQSGSAGAPKSVSESLGLYRDRLHPEGTAAGVDGWWDVFDDASARSAVADMQEQLDRGGWPVLEAMFSREAMVARLHDGDHGMMKRRNFEVFFARAEALLLMDAGPSEALESRLAAAMSNVIPSQRDNAEQFDAWIRTQAAQAQT